MGRRLRLAREWAGFTRAQAADEIDVARTTLVAIESGRRRVRIDELRGLAWSRTSPRAGTALRQLFAYLGGEVLFALVDPFAYLEAAEAFAGSFGVGEQFAHLYVRVLHEGLFEQAGFG